MEPDELVVTLDELFAGLDRLADRFGLEKIKTIGDAYMAIAGVPDVRTDHAEAAAEMALETCDDVSRRRWHWGDTVNMAQPARVRRHAREHPGIATRV